MNQIARCDWLPERARWSHLARSGLPAVSRKKNFLESHIINPLLTKFVRWRFLYIGLVLFCDFMDLYFVSVHKHAIKELGQYPAILISHLVNNPYVMTGHYEIFSRLDGSFKLWVILRTRGRKLQKRWTKYNYIFNNWKKQRAYRYLFSMSDEESRSARGCGKLLPVFLLYSFKE